MKPRSHLIVLIAGTLPTITALAADPPPKQAKADQIMLPKLVFNKATVPEAVKFLTRKSRDLDPAKTGVSIVFTGPTDDATRVSIDLSNISIAGAAKKIAEAANLEIRCAREARLNAGESPAGAIRRFSTEDRANCVAVRRGGEQAWSRTGRSQ